MIPVILYGAIAARRDDVTRIDAPGNIVVEVDNLNFSVTFDEVLGAISYRWRFAGDSGWTDIGADTSFDSFAAAGAHTVQIQGIEAGGVHGKTGTSDVFTLAPVAAPVFSVDPVATSDGDLANPVVGDTLSCSTGTVSGSPTLAYQWRHVSDNSNATGTGAATNTYPADASDEGEACYCHVTATNAGGSATADSNASGVVTVPVFVAGDISAASIRADGWTIEPTVFDTATGGTYDFGLGANNDPSTANIVLTVTSPGYDATGTLGTITRTIYGTKQLRKAYPDETDNDEEASGSDLVTRIVLSDFIYSGDTITADFGAGFYTGSNAASGVSVTNNSTIVCPKPIGRWAWVSYEKATTDFLLEAVVFHRHAQNGKPLAAVKFVCTDEHSHTVTVTATAMTVSTRTGDANKVLVYAATIPVSTLAQGDQITCNFEAYPWVGGSGSVLRSDLVANGGDGFAQPDERLGPFCVLNDKSGTYGESFAVVSTTGNDGTGAVYASQALAEAGNAYATPEAALTALQSYNNSNYSRANSAGGTLLMGEGSFSGVTTYSHDTVGAQTWVTVKPKTGALRANVIITSGVGGYSKIKFDGVTIGGTSGICFAGDLGPNTLLWLNNCICNNTAAVAFYRFKLCHITQCSITALGDHQLEPPAAGVQVPWTLVRGNDSSAAVMVAAPYTVLGNNGIRPSLELVAENTYGQQSTDGGVVAFNSLYGTISPAIGVGGEVVAKGYAIIQNVFEGVDSGSNPLAQVSSGSAQLTASKNILAWHNTFAGGRWNNAYNGYGSDPIPHTLYSEVGNIFNNWNQHQNDVNNAFDSPNAGRTGGWDIEFAVGLRSNFILDSSVSDDFFHGIYTIFGGTQGFVDDETVLTGSGGGNGDYHITSSADALNLIASGQAVLPFDIEGTARRNDGTGAAGAYEYTP